MGSLTAKELCDICGEDKSALYRSIVFLEENGYLICESNQKKRYRSPLALTDKGEQIGKSVADKIDRILDLVSNGLSDENRIILYESLTLISNNLENFSKKYEGE